MNPLPRLSPQRMTHAPLWSRPTCTQFAIWILAALLAVFSSGNPARAAAFNYSTDWMGNTFSGTNNAHVPNGIEAIAVTPNGTTYANSWWDEAAGEVSEFTTAPAWVNFTGYLHGFGRAGGFAIAVNSTYVYVAMTQDELYDNPIKTGTNAGQPLNNSNGLAQYPVNNTGSPNYTAITGNSWDCVRRYTLAGGVSAIPTYGYSSDRSMVIVSTTENDSQIGSTHNPGGASLGVTGPVIGIAANDSYVWVSDHANSKVHVYNASTMAPVATWTVPFPGRMVLDNTSGTLWLVENANNNTSSSIVGFDSTITGTPTPKGGSIACGTGQQVTAPNALAVDSSHRLVVADNGVFPDTLATGTSAPYMMNPTPDVARIAVYTTGGANPVYSYTLGGSVFNGATPGQVTPMGFHGITGLGFDSTGNFYVSCKGDPHDVGTGTYLRKFNSDATTATQTWQITGLQFVGGGSLDPANLNQFYSSYSGYSMNWNNSPLTGTGTGAVATWNKDLFNPGLYPTDRTTSDVTSLWLVPGNAGNNAPLSENHPMVFEVRDIQGKPFLFTDAMNMGNLLGVLRMNGNVAVPACLFGYDRGGWPADATRGKSYMWMDANGDGCMQAAEFTINSIPIPITLCGKWIDDNANIWTVNRVTSGTGLGTVTEVTLKATPLDAYGVPQYNLTTPKNTWVSGTNNVTTDTDWTGLVELAYLPGNDTMILAGNTTTHTSGATNNYNVIRSYPNWSTATITSKIGHAWEADGISWKGLYAAGSYVFASQGINNVNAISVYALNGGLLTGTFTPHGVSPTGLNDEDNPINVRVLPDGSYAVFQENDLTNNLGIYRWMPPQTGPSFHTTNVVDPNGHTLIQATSTGTANQTDQSTFATNVSSAYSNNLGGVVNFDVTGDGLDTVPAINANYGGGKTLAIALTGSSVVDISPLAPPSGTAGVTNCLSAPDTGANLGDITFTMGSITGGQTNEKVTTFAFTFLTQTVLNGISVTVTATFSDGTNSIVTRTVNRDTVNPTQDTFFGFVAPNGKSITSVSLVSNTTRAQTTQIDDVGFITSIVP